MPRAGSTSTFGGPTRRRQWRLENGFVFLTGAFYVGNGWVAGGCWDDDITSDDWDPSRKFPAFSTSKFFGGLSLYRISIKEFSKHLRLSVVSSGFSRDPQLRLEVPPRTGLHGYSSYSTAHLGTFNIPKP